ncbi:serine protease [Tardiphaga sp.]|uniref:S1C family serine protease n=1 Tax=Tardiphaga sp. TaxID=1926292 RepID=UPI002619B116|nr:serine protease [Tardiphaga sp.]MDB5619667.1 serine protease [Tardiphaga sp.]
MMCWPVVAVAGFCLIGGWTASARAENRLEIDEKATVLDNWTVGFNKAHSSYLATATYGDDTTVWIGMDADDGEVYFGLTNPNWDSIQDGKRYSMKIASVGGGRWQGQFNGISRNQEKGVISGGLKEAFVRDLIRSPGIAVSLGSRVIAKLNLDGSPAAFAAVLACQSKQSSAATPKAGSSARRGGSSGTGFFVSSQGHVLTNSHVVESCQGITIEQAGQQSVSGTVVARDKANDLAVVKTSQRPSAVTALRLDLRVGESIAVYGFPLASKLATSGNFTVGYVSALAGLNDDTSKVQISAPIQPGNSGGPVLDHYGNAVAVIVSTATSAIMASAAGVAPQNINFAIKAVIAKNFLDASGIKADGEMQTRQVYEFADLAERAKLGTVKILCE